MHPNQLVALIAGCLLAAVLAWTGQDVLSQPEPLARPMSLDFASARAVVVDPPRFRSFERYYADNDQNPFVPAPERRREVAQREEEARNPEGTPQFTGPSREGPPLGVPDNVPQAPVIPRLRPDDAPIDQPQVLGILRHSDSGVLVVQVAMGGDDRTITPGQDLSGWTLIAAGDGSATFRAPDGSLREIPIGEDR